MRILDSVGRAWTLDEIRQKLPATFLGNSAATFPVRCEVVAKRVCLPHAWQLLAAGRSTTLDDARREAFAEPAAILEFDAGLPRDEAERQAARIVYH